MKQQTKRVATTLAALAFGVMLAGCDQNSSDQRFSPEMKLPTFPTALSSCLQRSGVKLPNRSLTVGEVERFWKTDRLTIVVMRKCGQRIEAYWNSLQQRWR